MKIILLFEICWKSLRLKVLVVKFIREVLQAVMRIDSFNVADYFMQESTGVIKDSL